MSMSEHEQASKTELAPVETTEEETVNIEDSPKALANRGLEFDVEEEARKKAKMQRWGRAFYGDNFERYTLIAEMEPHLPAFRDFYLAEMTRDPKAPIYDLIRQFNESIKPAVFYPRPSQYQLWRKRWDTELLNRRGVMVDARKVTQVMKTKSADGLLAPDEGELEMGIRHLGGELVNDALDILHRDQETPELYDEETVVKRRAYVLNVFGHVTKMVHGKEALKLKKSAEARETAGFLMEIMRQATAGKLSGDAMTMLRGSVSPEIPTAPTP